ncbi:hypothetical protein CF68_29520, partial [Cupriavidus sp. SK-4]|uniref:PAAR domain-containing protein n=1 Tax=Cupriavidus sp. SK-4 TaxID=574750 RepID=UPI00044FD319
MADMREALRHGDQTTTGGTLVSTVQRFEHHGVRVAGEGDHATCPACKVGGPVMNDAYPSFTLTDGRQILVRGAKVMCQCANKPLVIPSQSNFSIEVNRSGLLKTSAAQTAQGGAYAIALHTSRDEG